MKKILLLSAFVLSGFFVLATESHEACESHQSEPTAKAATEADSALIGKVEESMNSGGYTYVKINTASGLVWAAGPESAVKVGDVVAMPKGMAMKNFKSASLGRTFDSIYFVGVIEQAQKKSNLPADLEKAGSVKDYHASASAALTVKAGEVAKLDGGYTIAEIYKKSKELEGKTVSLRAKVVKYTPAVMDNNWLHLQDGSAQGTEGDITATTKAEVKVGDIVEVESKIQLNRDLGFGYFYPVLLDGASIKVVK